MSTPPFYAPFTNPVEAQALMEDARATPSGEAIVNVCMGIARFLVAKNRAYGDSALQPLRVFSKASTEEQLRVRLDDKLSRLARGSDAGEDVVLDLVGYLVLLLVARERQGDNPS